MARDPRHPTPEGGRDRRPRLRGLAFVVVGLLIAVSAVVGIHRYRKDTSSTATAAERTTATTAPTTSPAPAATTSPATTSTTTTATTTTAATSATAGSTTGSGAVAPASAPVGAVTTANFLNSAAVRRYLSGRSGNVTAALYDVSTGTTSLWRPGVAEDTASIVKVDILATLLRQDHDAHRAMPAGEQTLATAMIEQSDNDAATDLWNDAGQETGIGKFNRLVPLTATTLGTDGYWGLTTTTAADQVKLVRAVTQKGPTLDAASRRYEDNLMENVTAYERWGVNGGVPSGVTVALKNGWLPLSEGNWQINSIGWIDGRGRDYILAVLSNGNPSEGYGIDTIQGLSALVWTHLAS